MLDVLARNREHVHIRLYRAKTNETLREQLARAQFEGFSTESSHALEYMLPLTDVSPLVGSDEIGDVNKQSILPFARGVDQSVDGLQHADFAEEIDLRHRERRIHRATACRTSESVT